MSLTTQFQQPIDNEIIKKVYIRKTVSDEAFSANFKYDLSGSLLSQVLSVFNC